MSDEYQLRKDIDRFKKFLDQLEAVLYTKLNIDDLDVNNWLDEYYTSGEIDTLLSNLLMNIDEKVDVETITQRLATKADKTELESAIANINYLLSGKANTTHYHTWVGIPLDSYLTLYVNETLGICELKFAKQFGTATANTYYEWYTNGIVPKQYRPVGNAFGGLNYGGILRVKQDGNVGGYFNQSKSSKFTCLGSVMWHYGVGHIPSEWYNHNSLTVNQVNDQTQLSNTGSSWGGYFAIKSGTSPSALNDTYQWDSPFRVQFDVVNYSGNAYLQVYDGVVSPVPQKHFSTDLELTQNNHIIVSSDGETIIWDVDGTVKKTDESALTTSRIGFRLNAGASVTFKNFSVEQ